MAKPVTPVRQEFTKAEPWSEGRQVAGLFLGAEEIPGVDSRKITFDVNMAGSKVSVWETAVLANYVAAMEVGKFYRVRCLGKTVETRNGKAWGFDVQELDTAEEQEAAVRAVANKDVPF